MRPYPFDPATAPSSKSPSGGAAYGSDRSPLDLSGGLPPPGDYSGGGDDYDADADGYTTNLPVAYRGSRWRWPMRIFGVGILLFVVAVIWLIFTAPLSKSLEPPTPPSITLLAEDGTPIARRGAIIGKAVDASKLPANVTNAFLAIEDRRFKSHWGVDPRGIARAFWHNITSDGRSQGGSTITQQLAKNAFLDSDRTAARKFREVLIAFWLEAWLSKNEILSRYLSNVYFGDNVYGLRAASKHYFNREPEDLSIGQAAMLAGLVKAPSRLAPTVNLKGARDRQKLVVAAMVDAGFLDKAVAADVSPARLSTSKIKPLPDGTYFADWVLPEARDRAGEIATETTVKTTLDRRLQKAAERAIRSAGLRQAQVALVAMRPDGRVVAMVGGKSYADSTFNRAVQARRQPGSAFKLFVYLAALRSGLTPDSKIEDEPVTIADWSPKNSDGRYEGEITLRRAFAKSSNVAAARLIQQVGVKNVTRAARDLGISTPIANEATIALGTSTVSLLELTSAYASIAAQGYPVRPRGIEPSGERSWLQSLTEGAHPLTGDLHANMLDLLSASAETGTGRQAALSVKTYGKTGTTQDNRDALFIGFAGDLVVGVWVGNDDNTPNAGLSGGGIPARIWRAFMISALGVGPAVAPEPEATEEEVDPDAANLIGVDGVNVPLEGDLEGLGLNLRVGQDGSIEINRSNRGDRSDRPRREDRAPRYEEPQYDEQAPDER
ncbi:PBP1A family penicillin-binding protein [Sphingomonas sp. So64.6b]|uniref:transglycosylase domain-containing protein n=1 Tax=Sphingomonas sp. So64.6b TaxID=2997354 RepID=UPI0015FEF899|nr:PBP1A family penicillin-binding protein [Sphingomonas sp. So64.6b]QNA86108.1 PBP1A family penicillin-binding protein [Sphingomonas sp. So64.6b]